MVDEVKLSELNPDFDLIKTQFEEVLATKDTWKDILTSGTGDQILNFLASVASYNQESIRNSALETNLITATLDTSLYMSAMMLGVHIQRRRPAQVTVTLDNSDITTFIEIPAYSQFTVNGDKFFNRTSVIFNVEVAQLTDITLHQGEVKTENVTFTEAAFQEFLLGNSDFAISDDDLFCTIDSTDVYAKTTSGLWEEGETSQVFFENTTPDGQVLTKFGNDIYGDAPAVNAEGVFTYVETAGERGNKEQLDEEVKIATFSAVSGTTTSYRTGGDAQQDPEFFRFFAPFMFSSKDQATRRTDFKAIILTYPGVKDAIVRGQNEIDPLDKDFSMVVEITLLTDTVWTTPEWDTFVEWLEERSVFGLVFSRVDPAQILLDIDVIIRCNTQASLTEVESKVNEALANATLPALGVLGFSWYLSDIDDLIKGAVDEEDIDYIQINLPTADTEIINTEYITFNTIILDVDYSTRSEQTQLSA